MNSLAAPALEVASEEPSRNPYDHGYVRVAAATAPVVLAQPEVNVRTILAQTRQFAAAGVAVAVFPELGLTGYSLDDIHFQRSLHQETATALQYLLQGTKSLPTLIAVGAPVQVGARLQNCALIIHRGEILGVVPKSYIPGYHEFYETRQFAAANPLHDPSTCQVLDREVPYGTDLLFTATDLPGLTIATEICEDLWVPIPPSSSAALAGATLILNLSSSPITVGKAAERAATVAAQSTRTISAYAYAAAGKGESTTDLAWDGQTLIYERGRKLAAGPRFHEQATAGIADIDLRAVQQNRLQNNAFTDNSRNYAQNVKYRQIEFTCGKAELAQAVLDTAAGVTAKEVADQSGLAVSELPPRMLLRQIDRYPFVPNDPDRLDQDCYEAYSIQVSGLQQRLQSIPGNTKIIIGISGGLDSTQALLVAARAMDSLQRPRTDICAYTMPGFATSSHTKNNAVALAASMGIPCEEIDIRPAAQQMLADLQHPAAAYLHGFSPDAVLRIPPEEAAQIFDVTFENVQAGLRTDYLFRLANHQGGIVLGTGDMSELALGWCTFGVGDHMAHYGVNAGVPKTLLQHLIRWVISAQEVGPETAEILESILDTEITPELIPVAAGETPQSTQDSIGPYALHDFTLFYLLQGYEPEQIAFLAVHAWEDVHAGAWPKNLPETEKRAYSATEILQWMAVFVRRFYANQYKRSTLPNGPKVLHGGAVSPRGDLRMPSDVSPPGSHD